MQSLKKPQALEILMRLLVLSRSGNGGRGSRGCGSKVDREQQQYNEMAAIFPHLPLQVMAASATLGRPLHRRLTAFIRWKEQQIPHARDPPLHAGLLGRDAAAALTGQTRRQPLGALFTTPQQRMRIAFERLAARGLLGLPRLPAAAGEAPTGSPLATSSSNFKALLPIIR